MKQQQPSQPECPPNSTVAHLEVRPLWKQIQPGSDCGEDPMQRRKNSGSAENEVTPVRKKKERSQTISNFLKHLQVEVEDKDERQQNQSEIVSILDVKYSDSFFTQKRNQTCKSVLADSKFHIFLLVSSIKEFQNSLKDSIAAYFHHHEQQLKALSLSSKKLAAKYEFELNQKCMELKNLELHIREQRLTNVEEKYRLESQLRQAEERNKQLEQKLSEAEKKLKDEQQATKNEKNYNKELNQLILKFHRKVEELEEKCLDLKKQRDSQLEAEIGKLTFKYQQLLSEQAQNYELKLENNRIKYENYIQSSRTNSHADFSKADDCSVDMTSSMISKPDDLQWSTDRAATQFYTPSHQKAQLLIKKTHQRMLENTSSPKSNTSGRRFARTSKPPLIEPFSKTAEKIETNMQTATQNIHASLNEKMFPSQDKTPRSFEHESNAQGQHRQKKHHFQTSQPDLQLQRINKIKYGQYDHSPPVGSTSDKDCISQEIRKILNNPSSDSTLKPTPKTGEAKAEQIDSNKLKMCNSTNALRSNQVPQNLGSTVSTLKTSNPNGGNNNKNLVYLDKRLRETIA